MLYQLQQKLQTFTAKFHHKKLYTTINALKTNIVIYCAVKLRRFVGHMKLECKENFIIYIMCSRVQFECWMQHRENNPAGRPLRIIVTSWELDHNKDLCLQTHVHELCGSEFLTLASQYHKQHASPVQPHHLQHPHKSRYILQASTRAIFLASFTMASSAR